MLSQWTCSEERNNRRYCDRDFVMHNGILKKLKNFEPWVIFPKRGIVMINDE